MYREDHPVSERATLSPARHAAAALVAAAIVVPAAGADRAPAQPAPGEVSVEAAFAGATLTGADFENIGVGPGGEVAVRYGFTPRLSLGLAGHAGWHRANGLDRPLRLLGVALEPRYLVGGRGPGLRPFVGLRLGAARWSASRSADTLAADVRADGLQAGGTAGVSYSLPGAASLEVAAVVAALAFHDAEVDPSLGGRDGERFVREDSGTRGSLVGLRALLRLQVP